MHPLTHLRRRNLHAPQGPVLAPEPAPLPELEPLQPPPPPLVVAPLGLTPLMFLEVDWGWIFRGGREGKRMRREERGIKRGDFGCYGCRVMMGYYLGFYMWILYCIVLSVFCVKNFQVKNNSIVLFWFRCIDETLKPRQEVKPTTLLTLSLSLSCFLSNTLHIAWSKHARWKKIHDKIFPIQIGLSLSRNVYRANPRSCWSSTSSSITSATWKITWHLILLPHAICSLLIFLQLYPLNNTYLWR